MGNALFVLPFNLLVSWMQVTQKKIYKTIVPIWIRVVSRNLPWKTLWKNKFDHTEDNRPKISNTDGKRRVQRRRKSRSISLTKKSGVSKQVEPQHLQIVDFKQKCRNVILRFKKEKLALWLNQCSSARKFFKATGEIPRLLRSNQKMNHEANVQAILDHDETQNIVKGTKFVSEEGPLVTTMDHGRDTTILGLAQNKDHSGSVAQTAFHLQKFSQIRCESEIDEIQYYFVLIWVYLCTVYKSESNGTDQELTDIQLQVAKAFRFPPTHDASLEPSERRCGQDLYVVLKSKSKDAFYIHLTAGIPSDFTTERFGPVHADSNSPFMTWVSITNTSGTQCLGPFHITQEIHQTNVQTFDLRISSNLAESFIKKNLLHGQIISFMASKVAQRWMSERIEAFLHCWNRKHLKLPLSKRLSIRYRNSGAISENKKQQHEKKNDNGSGQNHYTKRKREQVDGNEIATLGKKLKISDDFKKENETNEPPPCTCLYSSSFSVEKFRTFDKTKVYHVILNNVDHYSTLLDSSTRTGNVCLFTTLYEYIANDKVEPFLGKIISGYLERSNTIANNDPTESTESEDDCTEEEVDSPSSTKTTGKSKKQLDTMKSLETEEFWKEYEIQHSPGDGHCLLHSVMTSAKAQINFVFKSKAEIVIRLMAETVRGSKEYKAYLNTDSHERKRHLFEGLYKYVFHHNFNTFFGDIVPHILANSLKLQFFIIEKNYRKNKFFVHVAGKYENEHSILLFKTGMHYNAIIPIITTYNKECG